MNLTEIDKKALIAILEYVNSDSNDRIAANKKIRLNENILKQSQFAKNLPVNKIVYRREDFNGEKLKNLGNKLHYKPISFTIKYPNKDRRVFRNLNGVIRKLDLSKISGYYIEVYKILLSFWKNTDFWKKMILKEFDDFPSFYNQEYKQILTNYFIDSGILEPIEYRYTSMANDIKFNIPEATYFFNQGEILIFSNDTDIIDKKNILFVDRLSLVEILKLFKK